MEGDVDTNKGNENENQDNADKAKSHKKQQEQLATRKSFHKLNQRTRTICEKLSIKRQQLQLQEQKINNVEGVNDRKANDKRACKSLEAMKNKLADGANSSTKETEENVGLDKRLNQLSKKQLQELVQGFQELLLDITFDRKKLRNQVKFAATKIYSLRNFPIFPNSAKTSNPRIQRSELQHRIEDRNECSERYGQNGQAEAAEPPVLKEKESKKPSQEQQFARYINGMLLEYLGDNQQDKLQKYKCLPDHIEDLEPLATALVKEGYGCIVEEEIRINRKNNRQAFISMSTDRESCEKDAIIPSPLARRYAFDGDIVRAFVLNSDITSNIKARKTSHVTGEKNSMSLDEDEEPLDVEDESAIESELNDTLDASMIIASEKDNCRKAFVIRIVKQTELREVVGCISFNKQTTLNSKLYYKMKPYDTRAPMIFIPKESCMEEIKAATKEDVCGMIYVARILDVDNTGHCIGELLQPVGKAGNLQAEVRAILLRNSLKDIKPFEQKFNEMFDAPVVPLSENDLTYREDLRKKCVFTIDPLTAKDLDDAVSVENLNDFEYEIGVHISDVAFYLNENSELDNIVKQRATSIYLVNEVIHMLPTSLCFRCSLLPGEDKYAFSVFWKWHTEKEEFSAPRFTRSIINSCSQLAYEDAQKIIDNPTEELESDDIPDMFNDWKPSDIKWRVLLLHQIAQKLKAKRYENGALSINNPKLRFQLDPKTGEPLEFEIEGRREANFLIEEFMLLANQSVAKFIHDHFPDKCILRNHSPPIAKTMKVLKERLNNAGLDFDISSSKSIYESIQRLISEAGDPKAVEACLSALLIKPMARARYYCSEGKTSEADFWHYALSIPIYTHFTSPIRRYPDIMVHRLLAAALNYCPPPQRSTDELHQIAKISNDQKLNAKNAGDESIELFFKRYLKAKQPITLKAVVTEISEKMLNVVTIETGHSIPIIYNDQNCIVNGADIPKSVSIVQNKTSMSWIKLQIFSTLDVNIVLRNEKICGFFAITDGGQDGVNNNEFAERNKILKSCNGADGSRNLQNDSAAQTSSKSKKKNKIKKTKSNGEDYASFYAVTK